MKLRRQFAAAYDDGTRVQIEEWVPAVELGAPEGPDLQGAPELRLSDGGAVNRSPDGSLVDVSTGRRMTEQN